MYHMQYGGNFIALYSMAAICIWTLLYQWCCNSIGVSIVQENGCMFTVYLVVNDCVLYC